MVDNPRNPYAIPTIVLALFFVVSSFFIIIFPMIKSRSVYLTIGSGIFNARLATNDSERQKGLSNVDYLAASEALLMVFPEEGNWSIWMKDMEVPIDAVWLNSQGNVVYVVTDISPENSDNKIYIPNSKSVKYILEMAAGTVKNSYIHENSSANFTIDDKVLVK